MYISIHTLACVYIETQAGIKISGRTINDFSDMKITPPLW